MVVNLDMLSPAVTRRMEDIFQNDRSIFTDTRITQMLTEFPEDMAMAALNEFASAEQDPSNVIRSRPAYLMGVLRKYRSGERSRSNYVKARGGGGGGGGGGDSYRHNRDYSPPRRGDYRDDHHDDHGSGPPPSYGYAPPVSQQQSSPYNNQQGAPPLQQQIQQQQYSSNPNYGYGGGAGGQSPNYGGGHGIQPYSSSPQQSVPPPQQPQQTQQQQYPSSSSSQNRVESNPFGTSHRVRTRLEQMYGTGIVRREQIDARSIEFLSQMPDDLALQSLDEFSNHDTGTIRNHSAFLMSILRKNQTGANSPPSAYYSSSRDNAPRDSRQHGQPGGARQMQSSYGGGGGHSPPRGRVGTYGQSSYDAQPQQSSVSSGYGGSSGGGGPGSYDMPPSSYPSESTSQSSYSPSYSSQQQQGQQQPQYVPYDSQCGPPPPAQQGGGGCPPASQQHQPPQYGGGAPPLQQGDTLSSTGGGQGPPIVSNTSGGQQSGGASYSSMPPDQGSHQQYASPPKGQQQMAYYGSQQPPQSQYQGGGGSGGGGGSYPSSQGSGYNQQHQGVPPPQMGGGGGGGGEYATPSSSLYQQSLPPYQQGYGGSPSMQHQQPPPSQYVPPPGFEGITAPVVSRIERLFHSGFMRRDEFDDRMVDQLKVVPEDEAMSAVDEFGTCDRKKIRKIGAYFNGVLRKHLSRIRERHVHMRSGRPNKRRHSRSHSRSRSRDRFDSDRGGGGREFGRGGGPRGGRDIPPRGRDRDYNDSDRMRDGRGGSPLPHEKQNRGNDSRGCPPNLDYNSGKLSIPIQPPSLPNIRNVSDKVYFTLRALVAQGHINAADVDDRLGNALAHMDEGQAILALDEFGACDLDHVRNRGAYLMGLVKRYRSDGGQGSSNHPRHSTARGPVPPRSPQESAAQHQDAAPEANAAMSTISLEGHSTTVEVSTALGSATHMEGDGSNTLTAAGPPSSTTIAIEEGNAVIGDILGAPTSYDNTPGAMPVSLPYSVDGKPAISMTTNTGDPSNSSSQPPTEACYPESVVGTATATSTASSTPVAYDPEAFTMDVASPPPPVGALQVVQQQQPQPQQQQQQQLQVTTAETEMDTTKPPSFPNVPLAQDQVFGMTTVDTPLGAQVQEHAKPTVMQPFEMKVGEHTSGTVVVPVETSTGEQRVSGTIIAPPVEAYIGEQYTGSVVSPAESQVQEQVANTGVIPTEFHVREQQTSGATTVMPAETQVPSHVASGTALITADLDPRTATAPVTNAPPPSFMEAHLSSSTFIAPSTSNETGKNVANVMNSTTTMSDHNTAANCVSNPTEVPNNISGDASGPVSTCSEQQGEEKKRTADDGAATYSLPTNTEAANPMRRVTRAVAAVATSSETLETSEDVIIDRFPSPL